MSHATVHMHERGSFGSTYASTLMMANPTMNNRRNQLMDRPSLQRQEKDGKGQTNSRKSSPINVRETDLSLTTHTTTHMQIKYQYAGQSLLKAKLRKETVQKMLYTTYYLKET